MILKIEIELFEEKVANKKFPIYNRVFGPFSFMYLRVPVDISPVLYVPTTHFPFFSRLFLNLLSF